MMGVGSGARGLWMGGWVSDEGLDWTGPDRIFGPLMI